MENNNLNKNIVSHVSTINIFLIIINSKNKLRVNVVRLMTSKF